MPISPEQTVELKARLGDSIKFEDLERSDWKRQTDALHLMFIGAQFFVDLGPNALFVDGHINDRLKQQALDAPGGVKGFFNRRFHDAGYKFRRIIMFDTRGPHIISRRERGRSKLHFHALVEKPAGWSKAKLERLMKRVFGEAERMGQRQIHISEPRDDLFHSHNDRQVTGGLGKLAYTLSHAGTTYADLGLNGDGKRSRSAPPSRGSCNRRAEGLAQGIPSNFMAEIMFCDHASKKAGKASFNAWVKAERAEQKAPAVAASPRRRRAA